MHPPGLPQPNPGVDRVGHELRATGMKAETANPLRTGIHSRGDIPPVKREGASYFVTFRLADSLPKEALLKFEQEKAERLRRLQRGQQKNRPTQEFEEEIKRDFRRQVERYLDKGVGACHLRRLDIAKLT